MIWKLVIFLELLTGFAALFLWMRKESIIHNVMHRAYESLEQAAEKRIADNRKGEDLLKEKNGLLTVLEQQLLYSGLSLRFSFMTPEIVIVGNLLIGTCLFVLCTMLFEAWIAGVLGVLAFEGIAYLCVTIMVSGNYNAVDRELLKFLDFLGNYSITSGEVTNVLSQISEYLEEPLKTILEECFYEAQTSGDTGLALLSMEKKIQHPKFKELVRNMEISMRYSADFTILVNRSRRSVREHMRMRQEQKTMASEAWINILILGAMTIVILQTVELLIGIPVEEILLDTWVGRGCLGGIGFILFLFYRKIRGLDK